MPVINLSEWLRAAPHSITPDSIIAQECQTHFSQGGEDIAIDLLLSPETTKGLFVDIGAYHPIRFSNTFTSYINGWRGVNVDGNKAAIESFQTIRPGDINIHALVSDCVETVEFFKFPEGAWNTTDAAAARMLNARGRAENTIVSTETMQTVHIMSILDQYIANKKFDLLTIDAEGMDLRIVRAIDFRKYRPKVIALELGPLDWMNESFSGFLKEIRYKVYMQCMHTVILQKEAD